MSDSHEHKPFKEWRNLQWRKYPQEVTQSGVCDLVIEKDVYECACGEVASEDILDEDPKKLTWFPKRFLYQSLQDLIDITPPTIGGPAIRLQQEEANRWLSLAKLID